MPPDNGLPLFRLQATVAQSPQWYGAIRLSQPISGWVIAGAAVAIALALTTYLMFGAVARKAHIAGILVPVNGTISVASTGQGTVMRTFVAEGQRVAEGDPLFEIFTAQQVPNGDVRTLIAHQLDVRRQSVLKEHRSQIAVYQERKLALAQKRESLMSEATQLEQELAIAARRGELASESVAKYQLLQSNGYVSGQQVQQKQEEALDVASRLSTLKRNQHQIKANIEAVASEQKEVVNMLATEQAQLSNALAMLQQEAVENGSKKSTIIVAPAEGIITVIALPNGQTVANGQMLATLMPGQADTSILEAQLFAPSRLTGFVAKGQPVSLRYHAYPYQKFGMQAGTVTNVSATPFAPNELPSNLASTILSVAQSSPSPAGAGEGIYRIKVKLDRQDIAVYGQLQPLKPGITLEADVVQDRRRIWEWLLDPILAIYRRS